MTIFKEYTVVCATGATDTVTQLKLVEAQNAREAEKIAAEGEPEDAFEVICVLEGAVTPVRLAGVDWKERYAQLCELSADEAFAYGREQLDEEQLEKFNDAGEDPDAQWAVLDEAAH